MARGQRNYAILVSAALFIGLEIAAFGMLSSSSVLQNVWINRLSHRTMAALWGWEESVNSYFSLRKKIEVVTRENEELSSAVRALQKELLRAGIDNPELSEGFTYTPATIVKMSRNNRLNYVILDKGSEDGVEPGDGIITSCGVVGIVDAVDAHLSYGQSSMNLYSKVSARIGHSGMVGPLSWDGRSSNKAKITGLPLHISVEKGDTVYTSGLSAIFPAGIPLGTTGELSIVNGATNELEVSLFQDYTAVRYVTLAKKERKEEISSLEELANTD